jgi:hypothetical protein
MHVPNRSLLEQIAAVLAPVSVILKVLIDLFIRIHFGR